MDPAISVIVPIYNAEQCLSRCLDSICSQTLPNFETICVNDASQDASLSILKEYARRDQRIKIVDLPANLGEGGARNAGIEIVRGKYIGFVDSDDTIEADFFETLYTDAEDCGADMVSTGIRQVDNQDIKHEMPTHGRFCNSLFRAEFLKKNAIIFPAKFSIADDSVFMLRVFLSHPRCHQIDGSFYNYYQVSNSTSHSLTEEKCQSCTAAYTQIFAEIENATLEKLITAKYAQILFANFLKGFLGFSIHRYTNSATYELAALLIDLFAQYPYCEEAEIQLNNSDPTLINLLHYGDVNSVATYLQKGKRHLANQLRKRVKKSF